MFKNWKWDTFFVNSSYPQSYDGPDKRSDNSGDDRYERINTVFSLRIDAFSTDPSKLWEQLVSESTPLSALAQEKGLTNFEEMETWFDVAVVYVTHRQEEIDALGFEHVLQLGASSSRR